MELDSTTRPARANPEMVGQQSNLGSSPVDQVQHPVGISQFREDPVQVTLGQGDRLHSTEYVLALPPGAITPTYPAAAGCAYSMSQSPVHLLRRDARQ